MLPAGQRTKKVTIQQLNNVQNTYGEPVATWVDGSSVWAKINPMRGRELLASQQKYGEVDTEITMLYTTQLNVKCRIKYGNKYYDILGIIDPLEKHEELVCYCKEVIQNG